MLGKTNKEIFIKTLIFINNFTPINQCIINSVFATCEKIQVNYNMMTFSKHEFHPKLIQMVYHAIIMNICLLTN